MRIENPVILRLKFRCKMEFDGREVRLGHLEDVVAVGEEHVSTLLIGRHELVFPFFEGCQCLGVVTLDPAGFIKTDRFPTALRAILVQKAVLNDLKLQLADGADEFTAIELVDEQLRNAFIHKLLYAFFKLL